MRIRARLVHLVLVLSVFSGAVGAQAGPTVSAIDFVQTKDGQLETFLRFIEANWAKAREEMQKQGAVVSYSVLSQPPDAAAGWNVMLVTEYADMKSFEAREESYKQAVAKLRPDGKGPTLIDGKGARDLSEIKFSRLFTTPIRSPR